MFLSISRRSSRGLSKRWKKKNEQRKQEAPNFRKFVEDRMVMLVSAVHSAIDVLCEDLVERDLNINSLILPKAKLEDLEGKLDFVANSAHEAFDHIKELSLIHI